MGHIVSGIHAMYVKITILYYAKLFEEWLIYTTPMGALITNIGKL